MRYDGRYLPSLRTQDAIRRQYPGVILLWRIGDHYEPLADDDTTIVGLTCGSPIILASDAQTQVAKLIAAGHRVALCEPTR